MTFKFTSRIGLSLVAFAMTLALAVPEDASARGPQCSQLFVPAQPTIKSLGRISLTSTESREIEGILLKESEFEVNRNAGNGKSVIEALESHIDHNSPTALRTEEKSVVSEENFAKFLTYSQSPEMAQRAGLGQPLKWSLRDRPTPGFDDTTVTVYGNFLKFNFSEDGGKGKFVVKPRFRKYFQVPQEGKYSVDSLKSIEGELTALELKISNSESEVAGKFMSFPNVVFKPRIWLNDTLATKVAKLDGSAPDIVKQLAKLSEEAKALQRKGQPANDPVQVDSMFNAIRLLLKKDPYFLRPAYVVSYNRSSYKTQTESGKEYQFTADRNTRVYFATPHIKVGDLVQYLGQKADFESGPDDIFVELKSPPVEKSSATPLYTNLIESMQTDHKPGYEMNSGKYSIGRRVGEESIQMVDNTLAEFGSYFWMVKGLGHLPAPPKRKDLVEQGLIQLAVPFVRQDGQTYRALFDYEAYVRVDGRREAILSNVQFIDERGGKVRISGDDNSLLRAARRSKYRDILSLTIDGQVIQFRGRIHPTDVVKYRDFATIFYANPSGAEGNPREPEMLRGLQNNRQLGQLTRRFRTQNMIGFVAERTKRVLIGSVVSTMMTLAVVNADAFPGLLNTVRSSLAPGQVVAEPLDRNPVNKMEMVAMTGWKDAQGASVNLVPTLAEDGGFVFLVPKDYQARLTGGQQIQLTANGQSAQFTVADRNANEVGDLYLILNQR